jgi:hypothetical protein
MVLTGEGCVYIEVLSVYLVPPFRLFSLQSLWPLSREEEKVLDRVIIMWGAHHKTGTYLAQKIFAMICANLNWCCVFHVTR